MTKHVNEFSPRAGMYRPSNTVRWDSFKLKFNNIQTCIAVGLVPEDGQGIIGVHFTTASTEDDTELVAAITKMQKIQKLKVGVRFDAYLVANYSVHHRKTNLIKKLKKISRYMYMCDLPSAPNDRAKGANVDVKMERTPNGVNVYIRKHVVLLMNENRPILKPKYVDAAVNRPAFYLGKSIHQNDRVQKPWELAQFKRITR